MSEIELQDEEREVLLSIYDGDNNFKQLTPTVFQYKYGEDNNNKSFLLEIQWGKNYPHEKPIINMDAFYNKHISNQFKEKIVQLVLEWAEQYLGMSMTYSLFECLKEKFEELIEEMPEEVAEVKTDMDKLVLSDPQNQESSKKLPKKEQLTKAQKRKQWSKLDASGEKPRGWNWVDIVRHLSQTGPKEETTPNS